MARIKRLTVAEAFRLLAKDFRESKKPLRDNPYDYPYCHFSFQKKDKYFERYGICSGIDALEAEALITGRTADVMRDSLRKEFGDRLFGTDYFWNDPIIGKADPIRAAACDYLAALAENKH